MNKKLITIGIIILLASIILKFVIVQIKGVKVDKFKPVATIFVIDSSASNQKTLYKQKSFLRQMCALLDPEDQIKILKVSQEAYIIYEGSPQNGSTINNAMYSFTKYDTNSYGTAYGTALKKAFSNALSMQKEGYIPAIVVMGDLADEGPLAGQVNWDVLPKNVASIKKYCPEISMTFLFAHPAKLDFVKEKLTPVLGEEKLLIGNESNAEKMLRNFTRAIGR